MTVSFSAEISRRLTFEFTAGKNSRKHQKFRHFPLDILAAGKVPSQFRERRAWRARVDKSI
jgi:hypothetical protein